MEKNKISESDALAAIETELLLLKAKDLNSCFERGRLLAQINNERLYKLVCKSFAAYCEKTFELGKQSAYNYIEVYERFGQSSEFKKFSYTKLVKLLELRDDEITELGITPDMTVKEIDRVIKGFTAGEELPIVDKPDQCSKIKEKLCYLLLLAREQINEYEEASEAASLLNTYDAYIMSAVDNAFKKR